MSYYLLFSIDAATIYETKWAAEICFLTSLSCLQNLWPKFFPFQLVPEQTYHILPDVFLHLLSLILHLLSLIPLFSLSSPLFSGSIVVCIGLVLWTFL